MFNNNRPLHNSNDHKTDSIVAIVALKPSPDRWAISRNKIIFYTHTTIGISQILLHYSRQRPDDLLRTFEFSSRHIFIHRPAFDYRHTDEIATLR